MRLEIQLPKSVVVKDYHEFYQMQEYFKLVNKDIKVKELDFDNCYCCYCGIIYTGSLEEPENALLIKEVKANIRKTRR